MGREVDVIGIEEDGTRKRHKVIKKEVKEKCVEKYGNKFWVNKKRSKKSVRKRRNKNRRDG